MVVFCVYFQGKKRPPDELEVDVYYIHEWVPWLGWQYEVVMVTLAFGLIPSRPFGYDQV